MKFVSFHNKVVLSSDFISLIYLLCSLYVALGRPFTYNNVPGIGMPQKTTSERAKTQYIYFSKKILRILESFKMLLIDPELEVTVITWTQ